MLFFPFFPFYSAIVLVCQNNSEFHPHEKAIGWKKYSFAGIYAKNERFQKSLIIKDFRFLYIFSGCESYAFGLSELCFEALTCGKWAAQMPLMTRSKATNDNLRSHKWQILRQKVKEEECGGKYSLHNSFLDWARKLTKICRAFS